MFRYSQTPYRKSIQREKLLVPKLLYSSLQGQYKEAVCEYDVLIASKPDHVAWYNRQVALWTHHNLQRSITEISMDRSLSRIFFLCLKWVLTLHTTLPLRSMDEYFKEAWCKRLNPATLISFCSQPPINPKIADVTLQSPNTSFSSFSPDAGISIYGHYSSPLFILAMK